MSTTTFQALSAPSRSESRLGASVHALWLAAQQVAFALLRSLGGATSDTVTAKTAYAQAEELRDYACSIQAQDPEFAQDLFAAADRHEQAGVAA